jgi:hypothetical protein
MNLRQFAWLYHEACCSPSSSVISCLFGSFHASTLETRGNADYLNEAEQTSRVCVALLFSMATTALAQQPQPPPLAPITAPNLPGLEVSQGLAPDSKMPDPTQGLIRMDVTVTDKAGKSVTGLSEKDFTLLDNNQQQKVVTFQAFNGGIQPASSLEVVLVIDDLNMLQNAEFGYEHRAFSDAVREVETFLRAQGGVLPYGTWAFCEPACLYRWQ